MHTLPCEALPWQQTTPSFRRVCLDKTDILWMYTLSQLQFGSMLFHWDSKSLMQSLLAVACGQGKTVCSEAVINSCAKAGSSCYGHLP
jgi:hypothetical protein